MQRESESETDSERERKKKNLQVWNDEMNNTTWNLKELNVRAWT